VLRLLRDARTLASGESGKKWQDFAQSLIENMPLDFLHEFELLKLQAFTINLNSLKLLDKTHETMIKWAICERYAALRAQIFDDAAKANFASIVTAID
jgi:hypothetical protein